MLKKANRLRSQRDFKRTLAGQRLGANDCFAVYGLPCPPSPSGTDPATRGDRPPSGRIGFIVSKKVHKRSTRRNRIKRRLREILRLWLLSEARRSWLADYRCIVVIARSGSVTASYRELETRLVTCFQRRQSPEPRFQNRPRTRPPDRQPSGRKPC
jgi:ribonuclease P protein component